MSNTPKPISKNLSVVIPVIIILIAVSAGIYYFTTNSNSKGTSTSSSSSIQNIPLISKEEAKIQEPSPEAKQFAAQAGVDILAPLPNTFSSTKINLVTTQDKQTAITIDNNQVIPIYNILSATPVSDSEVFLTTGKYPEDNNLEYLEGDKKAYIYNYKNQTSKIVYDKQEDITDLFALLKDDKIVLTLGNRVDLYSLSGQYIKTLYASKDKTEQLIVADQKDVPVGKYKVYSLKDRDIIVDIG